MYLYYDTGKNTIQYSCSSILFVSFAESKDDPADSPNNVAATGTLYVFGDQGLFLKVFFGRST